MPHAHVRPVLLALAAIVALTAACNGDETVEVPDIDAREVLDQSAERMEALESFAFEVEHENGTTEIVGGLGMVSATGAVQGTERMRLEVEARFANTNIQSGLVILPGESYLQNPITGRWQRQDDLDISEFFDPASGVTALMRGTTAVEVVGSEAVGGVDCYQLEATLDSADLVGFVGNAEPGREVTAHLWVGVDDLLVRRIELAGPLAPDDAGDIVRRITLSDFDADVEITAPA